MVKIGARMVRAAIYGIVFGAILFIVFYLMGAAISGLSMISPIYVNGTTVTTARVYIDPAILGLVGFTIGFGASLGIELSKDIEAENERK